MHIKGMRPITYLHLTALGMLCAFGRWLNPEEWDRLQAERDARPEGWKP